MLPLSVTWVLRYAAHTKSRFGRPWSIGYCAGFQFDCDVRILAAYLEFNPAVRDISTRI